MASEAALMEKINDLIGKSLICDTIIKELVEQAGGLGRIDQDVRKDIEDLKIFEESELEEMIKNHKEPEVDPKLLVKFFKEAAAVLRKDSTKSEMEALVADIDKKDGNARLAKLRGHLDIIYENIWKEFGVESDAAAKAVNGAAYLCQDDDLTLNPTEKKEMEICIKLFTDSEEAAIGSSILGQEEFEKRIAQRKRMEGYAKEVSEKLESVSKNPQLLQEYVMEIQKGAMQVQKKIHGMSDAERTAFLDNPPAEEEKIMMKMQLLQQMLGGGGGHGHSHNGQPCGGHGHSHGPPPSQQAHGHSHDGKPCGGHGHSH